MAVVYLIAAKLAIATVHAFLTPTGTKAFITGAMYLVVEIPLAALVVQVIRGFAIPGTLRACTECGELVGRGFSSVGSTRRPSGRGNAKPSVRARMHSTLDRLDERVAASQQAKTTAGDAAQSETGLSVADERDDDEPETEDE
jgi:hypothetical protein